MKSFFSDPSAQHKLLLEAASWIGTPFAPYQKAKRLGVDCVQLAAAIYIGCGVVDRFDPPDYSMDGGSHDEDSQVVDYVEATGRFHELAYTDYYQVSAPGDLLCFRLGKGIHHVGIMLAHRSFIHVFRGNVVSEVRIDDSTNLDRLMKVYRPLAL